MAIGKFDREARSDPAFVGISFSRRMSSIATAKYIVAAAVALLFEPVSANMVQTTMVGHVATVSPPLQGLGVEMGDPFGFVLTFDPANGVASEIVVGGTHYDLVTDTFFSGTQGWYGSLPAFLGSGATSFVTKQSWYRPIGTLHHEEWNMFGMLVITNYLANQGGESYGWYGYRRSRTRLKPFGLPLRLVGQHLECCDAEPPQPACFTDPNQSRKRSPFFILGSRVDFISLKHAQQHGNAVGYVPRLVGKAGGSMSWDGSLRRYIGPRKRLEQDSPLLKSINREGGAVRRGDYSFGSHGSISIRSGCGQAGSGVPPPLPAALPQGR